MGRERETKLLELSPVIVIEVSSIKVVFPVRILFIVLAVESLQKLLVLRFGT
ncbi:MAG: hypothetical protein HXS54_13375 [Theionarchaea archaeon]|nr:hypothetical protein [Theionarchaea archaeon]